MKKINDNRSSKDIEEYKKIMSEISLSGKCPFCQNNFKYHKNPILKKSGEWFLTENSWPYNNAKKHLIGLSTKHKEVFIELTLKDFGAIKNLVNWAISRFKIKGGAFTMRFGDTNYTGASVSHIHFHLITPKLGLKKKAKVVNFPIG